MKFFVTVAVIFACAVGSSMACTCVSNSWDITYQYSTGSPDIFKALVYKKISQDATSIKYLAKVEKVYKGSLKAGWNVTLTTGGNSAMCGGVILQPGVRYLEAGVADKAKKTVSISICGTNIVWSKLSCFDKTYLASRPEVCPQSECLADPCKVTNCTTPYDTCIPNYCGACNAEFYSKGVQVCRLCRTNNCGCADKSQKCTKSNQCI